MADALLIYPSKYKCQRKYAAFHNPDLHKERLRQSYANHVIPEIRTLKGVMSNHPKTINDQFKIILYKAGFGQPI